MSHYDYVCSARITADDPPFYALVMAAMRTADSGNLERLRGAFPDVWAELDQRYHAPGGYLEGDQPEHSRPG